LRGCLTLKSSAGLFRVVPFSVMLPHLLAGQQNQAPPAGGPTNQADEAEEHSAAALQKATRNPVADLISVPVQNNSNFGFGPLDRMQDILNIQPVTPLKLNSQWNPITRVIRPLVWQPHPSQNAGGQYGLGDMTRSFFRAPAKSGKLIRGSGPALVIPTATSSVLGQGKFSLGPSVAARCSPGMGRWAYSSTPFSLLQALRTGPASTRCCSSISSATT
jgi:hypothetical protein